MRVGDHALENSRHQARLADACFAAEQHHLAAASLRLVPASKHRFELWATADQFAHADPVQRFEAAVYRERPQRGPGAYRHGYALQVLRTEIAQLEQAAEQPARAVGDDDHAGLGDPLQPRRKVRRLADDRALL